MPDDPSADTPLHHAVAAALARDVPPGAPLAVALSGGRDSVALLAALRAVALPRGHALHALHVDHGLSPNASRWRDFCAALCAPWDLPFTSTTIAVPRDAGTSLEAEARRARYAALVTLATAAQCHHVALGHHRDDQAETVLLQLLRGAGPRGLAAMPARRTDPRGVTWWRPLLDVDRATIDAYAQARHLAWIDDESNARTQHRRNAVRHSVLPALAAVSPHATAAIARAAHHQAEACELADDLAQIDGAHAIAGPTLVHAALAALPPHRARNLLRYFLRTQGLAAPSTARLAQMLTQLTTAAGDANVAIAHDGLVLGVHRGNVHLHAPVPSSFDIEWNGEPALALPHGTLAFAPARDGIDVARLALPLHVRLRAGGERFRLAADRPRRALGATLQEAGWPPWRRRSVPLVFAGARLVAVPGLGVDVDALAAPGTEGVGVAWQPHPLACRIGRGR